MKVPLHKRFGNEIAELREKKKMTLLETVDYLTKKYDVQISRFLRSFSFYIGSAVEYQEFDQELFSCDWVSLLAYKVGRTKQRT